MGRKFPNLREPSEAQGVGIRIGLLAASHDGHIDFTYQNVFGYALNFSPEIRVWDSQLVAPNHDDWLADEISLTSDGHVLHEIHFRSGCIWRVEAERVSYSFRPDSETEGLIVPG